MSSYFGGPRLAAAFKTGIAQGAKPIAANPARVAKVIVAAAPTKTVQVRAHTRSVPVKKAAPTPFQNAGKQTSPFKNAGKQWTPPKPPPPKAPAAPAPQPKTPGPPVATVRPAETSTVQRLRPNFPGEPVAGITQGHWRPDGSFAKGGHPYYSDAYTLHHFAGPAGQPSTQWNAATAAAAHRMQVQNYGLPGYLVRSSIPGGLNQSDTSVSHALIHGAEAASNVLPGGGVGELAGLFGFGLKGLRVVRAGRDVAEAAPVVKGVAEAAPKYVLSERPQAVAGKDVGHFFNQVGDYLPTHLATRDNYTIHNIHDPHGNIIGSAVYDARPDRPKLYVESVFIRPEFRNVANFRRLLDPVLADGRPIDTDISNPRLAKLFERFAAGRGIGDVAKKSHLSPIERGAAPAPLPPLHGPPTGIAEGPVAAVPAGPPLAPHATPEAAAVREALKGAPAARIGQKAGFSVQRGQRFAKAEAIYRDTSLTPEERQVRAKAALSGALQRPTYMGFKKLDPEQVTNLKSQIMEHGSLRTGQKTTLVESLDRAKAGIVPTEREHQLFEQVFGPATASRIAQAAKTGRWWNIASNIVNVPRTLQATFDMSAFLRQGAVALARHPVITGKNFAPMVRAFGNENYVQGISHEIAAHPDFPLLQAGKVALTGVGEQSPHEEQFSANMLEALGGTKNPIHWSSRAYSTFLNKTRTDVGYHLLNVARAQGINVHDEQFLRDLGQMVNTFTGRGPLPQSWERAANLFNGVFFSPRLAASRLNLVRQAFNPALARRNPFIWKQYVRANLRTFGGLLTVLGLAKASGLNVGTNPRSADFGKIKFGNTRVDLGAGFLQYAHLLGQLATGQYKSSTTGKVSNLGGGFGQRSYWDVLGGFAGSKLSPPLAAFRDLAKQQTNFGPYDPRQEAYSHLTPLVWQDVYDIYKQHGGGTGRIPPAAAGALLSIFGGGIQTYGPRAPKTRPSAPADYFGGSSGGGSDYFSGSSRGGSDYFTP